MDKNDISKVIARAIDANIKTNSIKVLFYLLKWCSSEIEGVTQVQIAKDMRMSRTFVIQGFNELREKGFVVSHKVGRKNVYKIITGES